MKTIFKVTLLSLFLLSNSYAEKNVYVRCDSLGPKWVLSSSTLKITATCKNGKITGVVNDGIKKIPLKNSTYNNSHEELNWNKNGLSGHVSGNTTAGFTGWVIFETESSTAGTFTFCNADFGIPCNPD